MTSEDYKEGFNLTIENAKNLMATSMSACEAGNYGIATSMNILAAEEAIKSLFLFVAMKVPPHDKKKFKELFISHKEKHAVLITTVKSSNKVREIFLKGLDEIKTIYEMSISVAEYVKSRYSVADEAELKSLTGMNHVDEAVLTLKGIYEWSLTASKRILDIDNICAWLGKANDKKNNGLYVGLFNERWSYPNQITKKNFYKKENIQKK